MGDWLGFRMRQLMRFPVNALLSTTVAWEPPGQLADGYSIAMACVASLAPLAVANFRLCAKNCGPRLCELIAVFDCRPENIPECVVEAASEISSSIKVTLVGYDARQYRVNRLAKHGWVYAWTSWCLAIARSKTRAVIIHDLDALPIGPMLFEQIYDHWVLANAEFCGINLYSGNGVDEEMGLVRTSELAFDSDYIRRRFRPIDLFNKMRHVDGRLVNFDTMLHAQWKSLRRVVQPIDEVKLVHPSQLICQYNDLISGRSDLAGRNHSLPVLPYFLYLGGDATWLRVVGSQLKDAVTARVSFVNRCMRLDAIPPEHWAWMEKQIRRLEQANFGETRPEVSDYLTGFIHRAGSRRSVGKETGAGAVPES